jgi:hypothetical protein
MLNCSSNLVNAAMESGVEFIVPTGGAREEG